MMHVQLKGQYSGPLHVSSQDTTRQVRLSIWHPWKKKVQETASWYHSIQQMQARAAYAESKTHLVKNIDTACFDARPFKCVYRCPFLVRVEYISFPGTICSATTPHFRLLYLSLPHFLGLISANDPSGVTAAAAAATAAAVATTGSSRPDEDLHVQRRDRTPALLCR